MRAPPKWAQDLVLRVALDEGRDDVPELVWRRSTRSPFSSGHYSPGENRIVVTAGSTRGQRVIPWASKGYRTHGSVSVRADQKMLVLHECAHWLVPPDTVTYPGEWWCDGKRVPNPVGPSRVAHSANFWDTAWRLYRRYRIPLRYARIREGNYRKGALVAASRRPKARASGPLTIIDAPVSALKGE